MPTFEAKNGRRKPRKYKGVHKKTPKTERVELTAVQRAFIAGACIAGDASFDLISSYFPQHHCSKSTILRTVAKVKERALELSTSITDSQCFDFPSNRGKKEKLTQEQKDTIIRLNIQSQQHREKESWQAIADGDFKDAGLPKISITLHQNVMYAAGYARRRPGWKPHLTPEQEQERYEWALAHNPDQYEYGDGLGFDFRNVVFTDETPARVGEQRGMQRVWCKDGQQYDDGVKKDRTSKYTQLQFYGAFRYQHKGPCVVYREETDAEKKAADEALHQENKERKANWNSAQLTARKALQQLRESDYNGRLRTRKLQYMPSRDDYKRNTRARGGVDGYRHREEALKTVVPWMQQLKKEGVYCYLLEDGAPAHIAALPNDYLRVEEIDKMWWPGHSPDVNAEEHAWPWIRRSITKRHTPSTTVDECEKQWRTEWERLPQEVIDKWVMGVPKVVRLIIQNKGKNNFHG